MRKWIIWGLVVGVVVLLGLGTASRLLPKPGSNLAAQTNTVTPEAVVKNPPSLQEKLMDPSVDLASRESLMEKIEIKNRLDENEKAGQSSPANKDSASKPAPAAMLAASQVETGIFEGSEGMVRIDQAQIQNYWRGLVDGKVDMVLAGSAAADKNQGLVILVVASLDPSDNTVTFEYFNAPAKAGSLRVVSEKDGQVALQTVSGEILQFDVKSRLFIK